MRTVRSKSVGDSLIGIGDVPEHELALDEAMLLDADAMEPPNDSERIRIWQFDRPVVVLGRSSRIADEVDQAFCESQNIPIHRRASGGASVVGGPGCLMYSVVIGHHDKPSLKQIDTAHDFVMSRVLSAVQVQLPDVTRQGICDLTWNDCKFSGNSLRISRRHLLYHGTILHRFDLPLIEQCLNFAPRQPEYRNERSHEQFVTNVPLSPEKLASDLHEVFGANDQIDASTYDLRVEELRQARYDQHEWRFRH